MHFEYEETPMEKVVSLFKPFTTIFYFHFLAWEDTFWIDQNLEEFEFT
jgi:hypothetical protein